MSDCLKPTNWEKFVVYTLNLGCSAIVYAMGTFLKRRAAGVQGQESRARKVIALERQISSDASLL